MSVTSSPPKHAENDEQPSDPAFPPSPADAPRTSTTSLPPSQPAARPPKSKSQSPTHRILQPQMVNSGRSQKDSKGDSDKEKDRGKVIESEKEKEKEKGKGKDKDKEKDGAGKNWVEGVDYAYEYVPVAQRREGRKNM
ncbi:hypothetical protein P7C73_g6114, partial [Tremellales sp. Uapishka_1]